MPAHPRAQAKDGTMNLSETLEEVLRIINCTPDDVRRFVEAHPPEKRLTKVWGGEGLCPSWPLQGEKQWARAGRGLQEGS